jgi:2-polyprenyl-3-methyl-5-hydroxy-6-metoxy-1,4-benzoquinol methylase
MEPARRCLVCDQGPPFSEVFERGGYRMVRCPRCGLVFQDPQPGDEVLARAYYHDEEFSRALFGELRSLTLSNARRKLALLGREQALRPGARVLDVGASSGAWLEVAASAGASASGIEIGDAVAARGRARGLDLRTGTLAEALPGFEGERFDLITFWDVLEHLRDPRRELELARGALAPGGLVAATFPNVEGLYPRLTYRLLARRTGVWEFPELPVHLYDFAPQTAERLFARTGFEVQAVRTFATPYSFYRSTSLSAERLGRGARARALRAAFGILHWVAYPAARLSGRENSLFVLAAARSTS